MAIFPGAHVVGMANLRPASLVASTRYDATMHSLQTTSPARSLNNDASYLSATMVPSSSLDTATMTPGLRSDGMLQSAGYLGPTSFISELEESHGLTHSTDEQPHGRADTATIQPWWTQRVTKALGLLHEFPVMKQLVQNYYSLNQSAAIPAPLIVDTLAELETTYNEKLYENISNEQTSALAVLAMKNTQKTFTIPPAVDGAHFSKLFTGSSIRLEIIGLIYTLAGRASYYGLSYPSSSTISGCDAEFPRKMLTASDTIIQLCKMLTPTNDLTMWLIQENLLLSSVIFGYSSSETWHRLGGLATTIFELGLHRDNGSSSLPEFLLETRRRLFAASYHYDKSFATFLGRPPLISRRHSDCPLPLDISDDTLVYSRNVIEVTRSSLTGEGWSSQPLFQRAAWIRLRYIISSYREEILELSLQKPGPERLTKLRDVSHRCNQAWNSLPEHLRYIDSCWDTDLPGSVKMMLIVSYLTYRYNGFLVERIIVKDYADARNDLLSISGSILTTVLTFGRQNVRSFDMQRDFIWTLLLFGFASASVLIRELQKEVRTKQPIPYPGSRATLIRNLSVFISHLESMARPGTAGSSFFSRATEVFSHIISEVLEPDPVQQDTNPEINTGLDASMLENIDGIGLLDYANIPNIFDQMLFQL
ncbi:hypothetical protein MGYG_08771 [Nannizzia gypsea CBS 118893]|uniref:Xylanolytic transcriptional activator regulatory domain-containing protein n=1 Tax=Arthroderma gypseum (strain ATCC MYA-4604 / CBS 118893) TaxID=535722 RepID=E4V6Y4_ARTGP|nr:hypothetical protein MGYG_08771 [Nannizzia gypsea CBS 118893]EFQ96850.1 hypothetical protein MGYG_08771 [Nannizzia gypsea CBS 118893]